MICLVALNRKWFAGIVGLLIVGWLVFLGPREVQLWRLAAAREARLNGDFDSALKILERLTATAPTDVALKIEQIETLIAAKQNSQAAEQLAELENATNLEYSHRLAMAMLFSELREHAAAYRTLQQAYTEFDAKLAEESRRQKIPLKLSTQERIRRGNNLAYFAYEADEELVDRWRQIDLLLKNHSVEDQFALYRSQALRIVGRSGEAQQVIEAAIQSLTERLERVELDLQMFLGVWMSENDWPPETEPESLSIRRNNVIEIRSMLHALYQQAANIERDLGDLAAQKKYNRLASRLDGIAAGVSFDLSAQTVARRLIEFSTYLDTRGCLATKIENWAQAQADLDAALEASYLARAITQGIGLHNSPNLVDVRLLRLANRSSDEALAIYHYHRVLLAEAMGDDQSSEAHYQATQRMGWSFEDL